MRRAGRRGFTLVEMMVVIVLIGIAAAAVTPALLRPGSARTVDDLIRVYRVARGEAAARGLVVTVHLDLGTGRYALLGAGGPDRGPDTLSTGTLRLAPGTRLGDGTRRSATAVFTPLGTARGAPVEIHADDVQFLVSLDPWTGAASREAR